MTTLQLKEANDLVYQIKEKKKQKENIEKLLKRMEEITGPYAKYVRIQLGEDWCYTPVADVTIEEFREFINRQKNLIDTQIKELELKFEEL